MKVLQSTGSRKHQEDGFFKFKHKTYFILGIIDGHGGHDMMEDIQDNYCNYFITFLHSCFQQINNLDFENIIKNFYIFLDELYISKKMESGCCISVIFHDTKNNKITVVQLGDTKIMLFDKDKNLLYQTHRLDNVDELNRIMRIEGMKNIKTIRGITRYKALMISRVLGDYNYKNLDTERDKDPLSCIPETITMDVIDEIYCLLMTDGIYELVNLDDIIDIVKTENFNRVHSCIFTECNNKEQFKDNFTIITELFKRII